MRAFGQTPVTVTSFTICGTTSSVTLHGSGTSPTWSIGGCGNVNIFPSGNYCTVTGVSYGSCTISFSSYYGGATHYFYPIAYVNPTPGPIVFPTWATNGPGLHPVHVCAMLSSYEDYYLTCSPSGGSWSGNGGGTGMSVTGGKFFTGYPTTANIFYTLNGCSTEDTVVVDYRPKTIQPSPATVCLGSSITLTDDVYSSSTIIGTFSNVDGLVSLGTAYTTSPNIVHQPITGVTAGTATIYFTLPDGCADTGTVMVGGNPIIGTLEECVGTSNTLTCSPPGGTWLSGTPAVATITSSGGSLTGVSAGTSNITYTPGSGCPSYAVATIDNCCLGTSLVINTGYDPTVGATGAKIAGLDVDNTSAVPDPKWTLTTLSSDAATQIAAYGSTALIPPAAADVVDDNLSPYYPAGSWAVNTTSNWITSQNAHGYYTNVNSTATYTMTFTRTFTTCGVGDLTVSGEAAADNYIISADVDGVPFSFAPGSTITTQADIWYGNHDVFTPFTVSLPSWAAGVHTITVVIGNYNLYNEPPYQDNFNPTGLNLYGTVSSPSDIIVSESSACSSYSCPGSRYSAPTAVPTIAPITGNLVCYPNPNGGSFTLRGALTGTSTSKEAKIEVVDMVGKVVYNDIAAIENGGINKTITLGDNIANGVYLIRVINDGSSKVIRVSINR